MKFQVEGKRLMTYRTMRSVFHEGKIPPEKDLAIRLSLPETRCLGFSFDADELFFTMVPDVYELLLRAARLDKQIALLASALPEKAVSSYTESTLIDEIVLTNNIEGVHSSRREISEVLASLGERDRSGRFSGLVQKYVMLSGGQEVPLVTCRDIRALYDDLVLDEVVSAKGSNAPDGKLFRAGTVDVCDGAGRAIHAGIQPEERIVELLGKSLGILNDVSIEPLVRVAVFHYLFGYIHPFYDGNGRTNRFISSYVIAQSYERIVSLRLSFAIKENINKYFGAYTTCEHALNRGDLTPFVIAFCEIAVKAMESMRDSLAERKASLDLYGCLLGELPGLDDPVLLEMANALVTATLFSAYGLTPAQLGETFGISRQTTYKRVAPLKDLGVLVQTKVGRRTFYTIDLEALKAAVGSADQKDPPEPSLPRENAVVPCGPGESVDQKL